MISPEILAAIMRARDAIPQLPTTPQPMSGAAPMPDIAALMGPNDTMYAAPANEVGTTTGMAAQSLINNSPNIARQALQGAGQAAQATQALAPLQPRDVMQISPQASQALMASGANLAPLSPMLPQLDAAPPTREMADEMNRQRELAAVQDIYGYGPTVKRYQAKLAEIFGNAMDRPEKGFVARLKGMGKGLLMGLGLPGAIAGAADPNRMNMMYQMQKWGPLLQGAQQEDAFKQAMLARGSTIGALTGIDPITGDASVQGYNKMRLADAAYIRAENQRRNYDSLEEGRRITNQLKSDKFILDALGKGGKLSAEAIADVEARYGIQLPENYDPQRDRLVIDNTGAYTIINTTTNTVKKTGVMSYRPTELEMRERTLRATLGLREEEIRARAARDAQDVENKKYDRATALTKFQVSVGNAWDDANPKRALSSETDDQRKARRDQAIKDATALWERNMQEAEATIPRPSAPATAPAAPSAPAKPGAKKQSTNLPPLPKGTANDYNAAKGAFAAVSQRFGINPNDSATAEQYWDEATETIIVVAIKPDGTRYYHHTNVKAPDPRRNKPAPVMRSQ